MLHATIVEDKQQPGRFIDDYHRPRLQKLNGIRLPTRSSPARSKPAGYEIQRWAGHRHPLDLNDPAHTADAIKSPGTPELSVMDSTPTLGESNDDAAGISRPLPEAADCADDPRSALANDGLNQKAAARLFQSRHPADATAPKATASPPPANAEPSHKLTP